MSVTLDETDKRIVAIRTKSHEKNGYPMLGEYVEFPDYTTVARIAMVFAEGYSEKERRILLGVGEFYLGFRFVGFSGTFTHSIPLSEVAEVIRESHAPVYFYHHDVRKPEYKLETLLPVRVWQVKNPIDKYYHGTTEIW